MQHLNNHVKIGKDALSAFERVSGMIGMNVAPQLTNGLHAMSDAFKAVSGSSKLGIGSIGAMAAGASAAFVLWKMAIDDVRESLAQIEKENEAKLKAGSAEKYAKAVRSTLKDKINRELALGNIEEGQAKTLKTNVAFLAGATVEEVDKKYKDFLETVFSSAKKKRIEDSENIQAFESFIADKKVELLSGFEKEREQARRESDKFLIEASKQADKIDAARTMDDFSPTAQSIANETASKMLQVKLAEIDRKEAEEKAKIEKEAHEEYLKFIQEEQRAQMFKDEALLREVEHLERLREIERDRQLQQISNNPFITDAEKYRQSKAAGADMSGSVDPDSFSQNMSAGLVQLQNQFGTFSQASAGFVTNGLGTAIQGVGDGIMGLIDRTKTWSQVWVGVLRQMAASALQFMTQQTAMFILNKGKQLAIHVATESGMTAATLAKSALRIFAGLKEAGVWVVKTAVKAASSVADIPYVGWALALAALAGVIAAGKSAIDGAREKGGPVSSGSTYLVGEKGPELFTAGASGQIFSADKTAQMLSGASMMSQGRDGASINVPEPRVEIHYVNTEAQVRRIMESSVGKKIVVKHIDGSRGELGMNT